MTKIPNFFVVGAPKCGTTTLYQYLKSHPEVFLPEIKELNFFNKDLIKESIDYHNWLYNLLSLHITTERDYLELFKKCGGRKIIGDISPWYFISRVAAEEIYKFNPESKILIILREPSELLYSLHSQMVYIGNEPEKNFAKALSLEKSRKKGLKIPKKTLYPTMLFYSEYTKYHDNVSRYLKYFSDRNIKIMIFDGLKKDSINFYKKILSFLDIKQSNIPELKEINKNKEARFQILQNSYFLRTVTKITPLSFKSYGKKYFDTINKKYVERLPMDLDMKLKIKKLHIDEIIKTSDLINKDLVHLWEYDKI